MTEPDRKPPALPAARVEARGVVGWLRRLSAKARFAVWSASGTILVVAAVYAPRAIVQSCRNDSDVARGRRARQAAYDRVIAHYTKRCPRAVYVCLDVDIIEWWKVDSKQRTSETSWNEQSLGARLAADHPRFAHMIEGLQTLRGEQMLEVRASVAELTALVDELRLGSSARGLLRGLRSDRTVSAYLRPTRDLRQRGESEPGAPPFGVVFVRLGLGQEDDVK